ncbi:hypothetical protein [Burkholderia gladioli]|uniref:hypothetical protein n=1 Tax=Burkholderia gladioli TaxID=28095 RepID=UPI0034DB0C68
MSDKLSDCAECGMPCTPGEYHPHAACLMFKGCHDSTTVRAGLAAIREHALAASPAPAIPVLDDKAFAAWVRTQDGGVGIYDAYLHGTKAAPAISESEDVRDAARYRWLRSQQWNESVFAVVRDPKRSVKLGADCPSGQRLDEEIDSSIATQTRECMRAAIDAARNGEKS